jgi:hypothetical protein
MGEWTYSSTIFDVSTRWRWVVSFVPLLLHLRGNSPRYPLDRRLVGPQNRSGLCEEEKNLVCDRNRSLAIQPLVHHYTDWAILAVITTEVWEYGDLVSCILSGVSQSSEGFQSRHAVEYGQESRGTLNEESLGWWGPAAI